MSQAALQFNEVELEGIMEQFLVQGATLKDARGLSEREMETIYTMGYTLYSQCKYQDAERVFKFLCVYNHLERKYFMGLAACRQMLKDFQGAVHAYTQAVILDVEEPDAHLYAAECLLAQKSEVNAESALFAAIYWAGDRPECAAVKRRAQTLLDLLKSRSQKEVAS